MTSSERDELLLRALFPRPSDAETSQQAVDIAVEVLAAWKPGQQSVNMGNGNLIGKLRVQAIIEINKDF